MITHTSPAELIKRAEMKSYIDVDVNTRDHCNGVKTIECRVAFNAEQYPVNIDKLIDYLRSAVTDGVTPHNTEDKDA
jgi:hypothetical protein